MFLAARAARGKSAGEPKESVSRRRSFAPASCRRLFGNFMSETLSYRPTRAPLPDQEQKQAALSYLNEAWAEARHDGVDGDCLAQASLFAAFAELVGTYGEDAVAKFVEGLPTRVRNGEFSLTLARQ
jgi:hypothetical protein